ncbi:hypothetical protein NLU13_8987 [Sarocladium strictum]|uniref:Uncharacterized protein n=1 Tax=Sarocladium strictum TaxID=5046 RepID=A0AA39L3S2_SARSR|nr:hypothetical protein NLU13_8987 [Sarocladium strictum]
MGPQPCNSSTKPSAAKPSRQRHFARLQGIISKQRQADVYGIMEEQVSQGRPDLLWSPCGDSRCDSNSCLDAPIHRYDMLFKRFAKDGTNGVDYIWQTIDKLSDVVWPGATNCADKMSRHMILGSFFHSPPVRSAYYSFRDSTGRARIKSDRKSIQTAICQVTPFVESIIGEADLSSQHDILCWYLGPSFDAHVDQRTMGDVVVRYMLLCEMWRRYPSKHGKAWNFGSPRVLCDLYGGMLLGMRTLELFKLLSRLRMLNNEMRNRSWGRWMQEYPSCSVMDNPYAGDNFLVRSACQPDDVPGRTEEMVLQHVGYLGGVGTYTPTVRRQTTRRGAGEVLIELL